MENDAQTLRDHFYSVDTLAAWIEHKQQESP
jgi:acyl carrier protein